MLLVKKILQNVEFNIFTQILDSQISTNLFVMGRSRMELQTMEERSFVVRTPPSATEEPEGGCSC